MNNLFSSKIVIEDTKLLNKILEIINLCHINQSQLLYLQKNEFNEFEKFIYDLAIIHLEKNNIELNDKIFIEFKIETLINSSMEIIYDKFNKIINKSNEIISPFLTTITYLDDIEIPDIITDVDIEMFKYKSFSNNKLYFSFPSFLKHIYFNGGKFYSSSCNILKRDNKERKILRINLWNIYPINIPYYINSYEITENVNKIDKIINLEYTNNFKNILLNDIQLDNSFFEKIMYNNEINDYNNIVNYFNVDYRNLDYLIIESKEKIHQQIIDQEIIKNKLIDISSERFFQRFIFKKIYDNITCNFIINESIEFLKNNENLTNYNNYKIINIEKFPSIIPLVINSFQTIIEYIIKSYCLKGNKNYNISNIFILKNDCLNINEFHKDKSSINVCILLNSKFEGGNILFDDELEYKLEQGDMIIFKGESNYYYLPVKNEAQYILFGMIDIYE